ncbi:MULTISPECIES: class I SAM-dependent methyltransferase [Halanaerobium]|jgi:ubiquinone/menaquinone biosynthesis C-methylase UbiE|uniref:Methyltransferase domain-containing protein n=1 Tax=Halanaerobium congolense TaxID=54121 RepID=A0A1G6KEE6_9FIRM|nr:MULTISPECIES: methyltransferase domain-containing protein [Halanaerobium]PUU89377.1 MAG: type 11 methyltransferase [Halanaerobium sp.]PXV66675.1 methyltransferase family protein [Halanaerobium congolense]SDC29459.1 Methyltransferase domain-containing protein [Halanaerobium congolense]
MTGKRFQPARKKKLFTEKRLKSLKPAELLSELYLEEGDIFIDVGAGNGFFSLPGAEIVGESGKVYSVDVEIDMLLDLKHRAQQAGLADRIEIVKSEDNDANLQQSADFMLFAYLFHEVDAKDIFLDNYFRFLKKGSRVVFIEWDPDKGEEGPPLHHRVRSEQLKAMLEKRDIKNIEIKNIDYNSYLISGIKV